MPLFDFHCLDCDKISELLVRSVDVPTCPFCASSRMEKLMAMPAAPSRSKTLIKGARRQAAWEGHFSHYSAAERAKLLKP